MDRIAFLKRESCSMGHVISGFGGFMYFAAQCQNFNRAV